MDTALCELDPSKCLLWGVLAAKAAGMFKVPGASLILRKGVQQGQSLALKLLLLNLAPSIGVKKLRNVQRR